MDLSCLIEIIPIIISDNENIIYDYNYKYLVPLEITSLNILNKTHKDFIKNILNFYDLNDIEKFKLDSDLIEKEKELFLFDEKSK